jgi:outer membrane protein assembly factor BamB
MQQRLIALTTLFVALLILVASTQAQSDWPRFRGPDCTGICTETGLFEGLPTDGPELLWQLKGCGTGYSSVAIVDGTLYTMGDRGEDDQRSQYTIAVDLQSRTERWATRVGPPHSDGPRCTPTIDGDFVYALGTSGDLVCLERESGKMRWQKNLTRDFGGKMMSGWKWSESPLIDGDRLICTPGAADAGLVALDKTTGDLIWKTMLPDLGSVGKDGAGYTSMVAADIDGVRQYLTILGRGAVGVSAKDGKLLWNYNRIANRVANIPSPVVRGNYVFVTTSYKTGSALLKLAKNGSKFDVEEVYFLSPKEFENHHGGVVLVGDHIYGGDGQNNGVPVCLDFMSGDIKWKERDWTRSAKAGGSAAVLYADDHLIFRYERDALVAVIKADPEAFQVKALFRAAFAEGKAWAHPVIHHGKLYLRTNDVLMCYALK